MGKYGYFPLPRQGVVQSHIYWGRFAGLPREKRATYDRVFYKRAPYWRNPDALADFIETAKDEAVLMEYEASASDRRQHYLYFTFPDGSVLLLVDPAQALCECQCHDLYSSYESVFPNERRFRMDIWLKYKAHPQPVLRHKRVKKIVREATLNAGLSLFIKD